MAKQTNQAQAAIRSERPRLSEALARALRVCREGKDASLQKSGITFGIMCGMLLERGLVREVKHRDHTRTYVPTETGLAALARSAVKVHQPDKHDLNNDTKKGMVI